MTLPRRVHVGLIVAAFGMIAMHDVWAQSLAATTIDPAMSEASIPGPMGDAIRLGHRLAAETGALAKEFVGNGLVCTSCHLDAGRRPEASPWVGITGVFPEYQSRSARVENLTDRINDCFERSMNGHPMPADDARMVALEAYMWWLSLRIAVGTDGPGRGFATLKPWKMADVDAARGKTLFDAKCSMCHGADGAGTRGAEGAYVFPPLWGAASFNIGAGMARIGTAAAFVMTNMPVGAERSLSQAEALDIAAYFTRQPRPDFVAKSRDWPAGDRPADAPY